MLDKLAPQRQRVGLHVIETCLARCETVHGIGLGVAVESSNATELRRLVSPLAVPEQLHLQFPDQAGHETADEAPNLRLAWHWDGSSKGWSPTALSHCPRGLFFAATGGMPRATRDTA